MHRLDFRRNPRGVLHFEDIGQIQMAVGLDHQMQVSLIEIHDTGIKTLRVTTDGDIVQSQFFECENVASRNRITGFQRFDESIPLKFIVVRLAGNDSEFAIEGGIASFERELTHRVPIRRKQRKSEMLEINSEGCSQGIARQTAFNTDTAAGSDACMRINVGVIIRSGIEIIGGKIKILEREFRRRRGPKICHVGFGMRQPDGFDLIGPVFLDGLRGRRIQGFSGTGLQAFQFKVIIRMNNPLHGGIAYMDLCRTPMGSKGIAVVVMELDGLQG